MTTNRLSNEQLVQEIEAQRGLMISVSTGGPPINDRNDEYRERRRTIGAELAARGIADPNPYSDLWAWYGKWSSGDLPSYQSRRIYIGELLDSIIDQVREDVATAVFTTPTGWTKVDRQMDEVRQRLAGASNEEQYQGVGHVCREVFISLAEEVFVPFVHESVDGVTPSPTDVKRQLEAYLQAELGGSSQSDMRKHVRGSFDFANVVQHKRTAVFRDAAICAELTASVVNLIAIISGRRDA